MYKAFNKVRMHDTDMAGILFFANQFRFVNDAWEDLMESEGIFFDHLFNGKKDYAFVIVHADADYLAPLKVADHLEVHVKVEHIGNTSFTVGYLIHKVLGEELQLVGKGKTVHVAVDPTTRTKLVIPPEFRLILDKHSLG
jgi:1,4-dihydroxy-2-naphthoyl-CoA hydrolase